MFNRVSEAFTRFTQVVGENKARRRACVFPGSTGCQPVLFGSLPKSMSSASCLCSPDKSCGDRARFFIVARVDVDLVKWSLRLAHEDDIPALEQLIPLSARGLRASYYSATQVDTALGTVFGVDRQLIRDGTYYVVEHPPSPGSGATGGGELIGCGGWSKRKTLFGSDHQTNRDDAELDPATEPARIRAFFIHPDHARRGIGRAILDECEKAIQASRDLKRSSSLQHYRVCRSTPRAVTFPANDRTFR